jgi:hypothetical protein
MHKNIVLEEYKLHLALLGIVINGWVLGII